MSSQTLEKILKKIDKRFQHLENVSATLTNNIKYFQDALEKSEHGISRSQIDWIELMLEYQIVGAMAGVHQNFSMTMMKEAQDLYTKSQSDEMKSPENMEMQKKFMTASAERLKAAKHFKFLYDNTMDAIEQIDKTINNMLVKKYPSLGREYVEEEENTHAQVPMKCFVCGKPTQLVANKKFVCRDHYKAAFKEEKTAEEVSIEELRKKRIEELQKVAEDSPPGKKDPNEG